MDNNGQQWAAMDSNGQHYAVLHASDAVFFHNILVFFKRLLPLEDAYCEREGEIYGQSTFSNFNLYCVQKVDAIF